MRREPMSAEQKEEYMRSADALFNMIVMHYVAKTPMDKAIAEMGSVADHSPDPARVLSAALCRDVAELWFDDDWLDTLDDQKRMIVYDDLNTVRAKLRETVMTEYPGTTQEDFETGWQMVKEDAAEWQWRLPALMWMYWTAVINRMGER